MPWHSNPLSVRLPFGTGRQYATAGSGVLLLGRGCLTYAEVFENNVGAASLTLYDGTSANGQVILDYTLTQGQSTSDMFGLHWVQFVEGLYVTTSGAGQILGSISAWVNHDCAEYNGAVYHAALAAQAQVELTAAIAAGVPIGTSP